MKGSSQRPLCPVHVACLSCREMPLRRKALARPTLRFGRGTELETMSRELNPTGEKWSKQYSKVDRH